MTAINRSHSVFAYRLPYRKFLHATKRVRDFDVLIERVLHLSKSLPFTNTSMKMVFLSVNGRYGYRLSKHCVL